MRADARAVTRLIQPAPIRPTGASTVRPAIDPARLAAANINPNTGLATDYLNHFNEAIMLLEMVPELPDCIDDLNAWRPLSYTEHFEASGFKHRELAIEAYHLADPRLRDRLEELANVMNAMLVSTNEAMSRSSPEHAATLAVGSVAQLKHLVAQAGAVIHGAAAAAVETAESDTNQAEIDALLER
jgi:hypothetical protein